VKKLLPEYPKFGGAYFWPSSYLHSLPWVLKVRKKFKKTV
jgi:hypothetical protein